MNHKHKFKRIGTTDRFKCQEMMCGQVRGKCSSCGQLASQVNIMGHCIPCSNSKGFSSPDPDEGDKEYEIVAATVPPVDRSSS